MFGILNEKSRGYPHFACNVGDYIDLPQLVIVGAQSSRKRSVLGGLTGFPFPRDTGLGARFVTKITFR